MSPDCLKEIPYDLIVLAVKEEQTALEIKKELLLRGMNEEIIVWKKPVCIY